MTSNQNGPVDIRCIDQNILSIFQGLVDLLVQNCGVSVQEILKLSKDFMKDQSSEAVKEFFSMVQSGQNDRGGPANLNTSKLKKNVEEIILLDECMKARLVPVLGGLQFEDAMRQRLSHLTVVWFGIDEIRNRNGDRKEEYKKLADKVSDLCASTQETKDFYETVLREPPPEVREDSNIVLEF